MVELGAAVDRELSTLVPRAGPTRRLPPRARLVRPAPGARRSRWRRVAAFACTAAAAAVLGLVADDLTRGAPAPAMSAGAGAVAPRPTDRSSATDAPAAPPPAALPAVALAPTALPAAAAPDGAAPEARAPVQRAAAGPARQPASEPTRREARAARPAAREPARGARRQAAACRGLSGGALARCADPQLMSADRRLRRAYDRAVRAGVSRQELISYRTRWSRLRRQARTDPLGVTSAYDRLAGELNRAAADR